MLDIKPGINKVVKDKMISLWLWFIYIFFIIIMCLMVYLLWIMQAPYKSVIPMALHSILKADYGPDPRGYRVAGVRYELIGEIMSELDATTAPDRYATLQNSRLTPVPTVTPLYLFTYTPTLLPITSGTPAAFTPTNANVTPSVTSSHTPRPGETITPIFIPTPSLTAWSTPTPRPPTQPVNTFTPGPSNPTVTSTPTVPSVVYTPTNTSTLQLPTSTQTKQIPTATPMPPPTRTPNPYPLPTNPPPTIYP